MFRCIWDIANKTVYTHYKPILFCAILYNGRMGTGLYANDI